MRHDKTNSKHRKYGKGFTLVELLLYMGLLAILLISFTQLFTTILNAQLESQATSNLEENARFILLRLTHDIKAASQIIAPSTLGAPSSTLVLTINGTTNTYALQNNNLLLNTDLLNSFQSSISALTFTRLGSNSATAKDAITFSFTMTDLTQQTSGQATKSYTTTVATR